MQKGIFNTKTWPLFYMYLFIFNLFSGTNENRPPIHQKKKDQPLFLCICFFLTKPMYQNPLKPYVHTTVRLLHNNKEVNG
jgi:hypothetical protein